MPFMNNIYLLPDYFLKSEKTARYLVVTVFLS